MHQTIQVSSCVSVRGEFVELLPNGDMVIRVGGIAGARSPSQVPGFHRRSSGRWARPASPATRARRVSARFVAAPGAVVLPRFVYPFEAVGAEEVALGL